MLQRLWSAAPLLLVFATLFWSGNFVLGRAVHEHVPPIALSFWRWVLALLLLMVFAGAQLRRDLPVLRAHWRLLLVLSFLGTATFNALVYCGLHTTTATNAVLMQSVMPVLIVFGSLWIFRESVRPLQVAALALSLAGVATIAARGSLDALLALSLVPGDGLVLLAVVFYALYSVLLRRRPAVHPLSFIAATFALGALMLLPPYVYEHVAVAPLRLDGMTLAAVAYVGVFPSLLAYLCFNRAVELIGANRAGQYLHLMPLFGSTLAALFVNERLQAFHLAGALLIAAGIVLAARR